MVMKSASHNQTEKRIAGESAAALVKDGMVIGLGTGSTVAWTINMLGQRIREEDLQILGIATSYQSEALAVNLGIRLTTLNEHPFLDLAIDGADQVDNKLFGLKGGGAAHTREKIISCSAKKFVVVIDKSKFRENLNRPVSVEVLPFASKLVDHKMKALGGRPILRQGRMKDGPVITDNGNFIMDVDFGIIEDPPVLAEKLDRMTGLIEHGIFDNIDELHMAQDREVSIFYKV
ncbi:MAG: ribose-5-phosphate isomerase RpiA [Methanotrichaceae archaeon]|nr:ribose-5-phosphate isomerase RpiA [Methanotrichaceae archaeon]